MKSEIPLEAEFLDHVDEEFLAAVYEEPGKRFMALARALNLHPATCRGKCIGCSLWAL
ncbi:MAG TPA: hypothetical protein VK436_12425 [Methanocella sp.]|nr:hypothetical protein [Methanocella sp.]